ncbi:MAG: hypothetical protein J6W40_05080 [Alphaproteobacteria bacterium]|nr:hypothetical protein [Alphaproteobacteria bacterium]
MPTKTVKKTPAKKPAKKVVKPVVAPKPAAAEIPLPDPYCHCTKRKRNMILTCVFICSFILGFIVAQLFCFCGCDHHKRMPRPHFVNGCLEEQSVKCPKMLEALPAMDADNNGCITRAELRAAKRAMRHHHEEAPTPVVEEPEVNVEEALAPAVEE